MKPGSRMAGMCVGMTMALGILAGMPARAAGPAPVDLGSAGAFAILAETAIFNTGATSIVGDIGLSPTPATSISGFALTLDSTGTFSTSLLVDGRVLAANYAPPTPGVMSAAVGAMEDAYIDARDRPLPDFTGLYGGVLTGQTLVPGLYEWGTDVLISASGVTLSGGPTDVWIFQIAQDLTVAAAGIVTLAGGASAANIFWQVTGETTLGPTARMKGIVLCATQIAMSTDAQLLGKALSQTSVTLDANVIYMAAGQNARFIDGFETGDFSPWSGTVD